MIRSLRFSTKSSLYCNLIPAWWYMHVSDFPSFHLCVCIRSPRFVKAVIHALHSFSFLCLDVFIHALHSFMCYSLSCAAFLHMSHSFMHCIHPSSPSIHALFFAPHLSMLCTYPCFAVVHVSHLFKRCTY